MTRRLFRRSRPCSLRAGLVLAFLAAATGAAAGQERQFGVRGGAALTTVANETSAGTSRLDPRTALAAGAFFTWPLGWFALQPEVLYTSKGAVFADEGVDARLVLDYVEVPVLISRPVARLGPAQLYVSGGPAFAVRVRARSRTVFGGATEELDLRDDVERSDLGAVIAATLRVGAFVLDGRFTHGLRDIDRDDEVAVRNRAITITAGVTF